MPYVLVHDRTLHFTHQPPAAARSGTFTTSLASLNSILPTGNLATGAFARGAVHELLHPPNHPPPAWVASQIALALIADSPAATQIVWLDPTRRLNPAALFASGIPPGRLLILRTASSQENLWAVRQSLTSPATAAVIAVVRERLTPAAVRRLQLAAESQSTSAHAPVAILLRPDNADARVHAAATRILVEPAPASSPFSRQWKLRLLHGSCASLNQTVLIERHHAPGNFPPHLLRPPAEFFGRPHSPDASEANFSHAVAI